MGATFVLVLISACLHAGWNLLAHRRRGQSGLLFQIPVALAACGVVPAVVAEVADPAIDRRVLLFLAATGVCQAVYYLGLLRAYASEDFGMVYPLSRALPVLLLVAFDLARGREITVQGAAGMLLIAAGCLFAPLRSPRDFAKARYLNRTMAWVGVTAMATVGYTIADKLALEALPRGAAMAARYSVWQAVATLPFLWALTLRERPGTFRGGWGWAFVAAAFSFGSYGLVLWAYQLTAQASYVVALRQISVPLGVLASGTALGEQRATTRIVASLAVAVGAALLLTAG